MKRYFILLNPQTLEVGVSEPLEVAPDNSIEVKASTNYNFRKAVFDRFPNPAAVIEGMTPEEKEIDDQSVIADVKAAVRKELAVTDWYIIRKLERDIDVPQEISELRAGILQECESKINELSGNKK